MNKTILILSAVILYFFYSQLKNMTLLIESAKKDMNTTLIVTSLLKDRLDIKDKEVEAKQLEIVKYQANYEAFNGTACMKCHLEPHLQLPIKNHALSLEDYIQVVREGVVYKMPSYVNSPRKGPNDITDSELRRQYKILRPIMVRASELMMPQVAK